MKIQLTTEWILTTLPSGRSMEQSDPKFKGQTPWLSTTEPTATHLVELALNELDVDYMATDGELGEIVFWIQGVTNELFWTETIKGKL